MAGLQLGEDQLDGCSPRPAALVHAVMRPAAAPEGRLDVLLVLLQQSS